MATSYAMFETFIFFNVHLSSLLLTMSQDLCRYAARDKNNRRSTFCVTNSSKYNY